MSFPNNIIKNISTKRDMVAEALKYLTADFLYIIIKTVFYFLILFGISAVFGFPDGKNLFATIISSFTVSIYKFVELTQLRKRKYDIIQRAITENKYLWFETMEFYSKEYKYKYRNRVRFFAGSDVVRLTKRNVEFNIISCLAFGLPCYFEIDEMTNFKLTEKL